MTNKEDEIQEVVEELLAQQGMGVKDLMVTVSNLTNYKIDLTLAVFEQMIREGHLDFDEKTGMVTLKTSQDT